MQKGKLGVIGGMGPQAMLQFCQRILDHTAAQSDQEHLPMLILNDTQMPDRTAALLSGDIEPVCARLLSDARQLESWGATAVAITCNTAHAFLPRLQGELKIPLVNMVTETAAALKSKGCRRVGILATDGTLRVGLYHQALEAQGIQLLSPAPAAQRQVMEIIYGEIKKGLPGSEEKFRAAADSLKEQGCECILLACTEMSTYKDWHHLDDFYVDAMDVLACRCIQVCGYPLRDV